MSVQRALGAGLAATAFAGTVVAAPVGAAAAAPAALVLTVKVAGKQTAATLRCSPPRGSHPLAAAACQAVDAVDGRLERLRPTDGVLCTMEYQPATASAAGTWRGRPVRYRKTFSNACVLGGATGAVFRF